MALTSHSDEALTHLDQHLVHAVRKRRVHVAFEIEIEELEDSLLSL
jgi:hypothetical protein